MISIQGRGLSKISVACVGDFVDVGDGTRRVFVHRSQLVLVLDDHCVLIDTAGGNNPLYAIPDEGMSASELFDLMSKEVTGTISEPNSN